MRLESLCYCMRFLICFYEGIKKVCGEGVGSVDVQLGHKQAWVVRNRSQ